MGVEAGGPRLHFCPPDELYTPRPRRSGESCALRVILEGCLAKGLSWWEWDAGSLVSGVVVERVYGAVAFRSFCYKVRIGTARLLEWVVCVKLWIAHPPELSKAYSRK